VLTNGSKIDLPTVMAGGIAQFTNGVTGSGTQTNIPASSVTNAGNLIYSNAVPFLSKVAQQTATQIVASNLATTLIATNAAQSVVGVDSTNLTATIQIMSAARRHLNMNRATITSGGFTGTNIWFPGQAAAYNKLFFRDIASAVLADYINPLGTNGYYFTLGDLRGLIKLASQNTNGVGLIYDAVSLDSTNYGAATWDTTYAVHTIVWVEAVRSGSVATYTNNSGALSNMLRVADSQITLDKNLPYYATDQQSQWGFFDNLSDTFTGHDGELALQRREKELQVGWLNYHAGNTSSGNIHTNEAATIVVSMLTNVWSGSWIRCTDGENGSNSVYSTAHAIESGVLIGSNSNAAMASLISVVPGGSEYVAGRGAMATNGAVRIMPSPGCFFPDFGDCGDYQNGGFWLYFTPRVVNSIKGQYPSVAADILARSAKNIVESPTGLYEWNFVNGGISGAIVVPSTWYLASACALVQSVDSAQVIKGIATLHDLETVATPALNGITNGVVKNSRLIGNNTNSGNFYTVTVLDLNSAVSIDLHSGNLRDTADTTSLDWLTRSLNDETGGQVANWDLLGFHVGTFSADGVISGNGAGLTNLPVSASTGIITNGGSGNNNVYTNAFLSGLVTRARTTSGGGTITTNDVVVYFSDAGANVGYLMPSVTGSTNLYFFQNVNVGSFKLTNSAGSTVYNSTQQGEGAWIQCDGGVYHTVGTIGAAISLSSIAPAVTTNNGTLTSGQLIAGAGNRGVTTTDLTGDVTTSGGVATTVAKIQGTTVSGTTGSGYATLNSGSSLTNSTFYTNAASVNAAVTIANQSGMLRFTNISGHRWDIFTDDGFTIRLNQDGSAKATLDNSASLNVSAITINGSSLTDSSRNLTTGNMTPRAAGMNIGTLAASYNDLVVTGSVVTVKLAASTAADQTTTSASLANIPGMTVTNVVAAGKYKFDAYFYLSDSVSADGAVIDFGGGTATATDFRAHVTTFDSALNLSSQLTSLTGTAASATLTGSSMCEVHGHIVVNAAGTIIPRFAQNAHTTGTLTLFRGSNIQLTEIR
jgi:hypothetical protein